MGEEIIDEKKGKLSFLDFLATLKWLFVFNFKLSPWAATSQVLTRMILDTSPLFNAYIFARLIDKIIKIASSSNSNINDIIPLLILLLMFNLAISALNSVYSYISDVMSHMSSFKVPIILAKHISSLGIQTLENPDVVNKIQRVRETINMVNNDFENMVAFIAKFIVLISASFIVVKIMPLIAIVIVIAIVPELISNRLHMKKNWGFIRQETENQRRAFSATGSLNEVGNLQEITITSSFELLSKVFTTFSDRYMKEKLKILKSWRIFDFILGSITDIASIFGYFSILKNLFFRLISIGDVTFQMKSLDIFVSNLGSFTNRFSGLYERSVRINEIKTVFEMLPMVNDGSVKLPKLEATPSIKFNNISFKYPGADKYVIENLSLDIKPGEKIAIVGENGAGKTTLIKLLSRFYKVDEGSVSLNDININDIEIKSWYKNLGVLFQDYNTYGYLTLKENIYIGQSDEPLDMPGIETAAKQANIDSFVGDYKKGYEQVLSEKYKGGTRPSMGQWQKIAIARFFYRNSPVVVFDEPTASIDAVSEAEIFGKIYNFFKGKTVIIISHRFSTVRNADKIYVLDKGQIIESGNHAELIKLKGKYFKAFNIQAKGYK
jgi:ATP-binding cassette subfamily B protein